MKISFMTHACPEWGIGQVVDAAVRYGYQGVEFRTDTGNKHGVQVTSGNDERAAIRRTMEKAGIAACSIATGLFCHKEQFVADAPAYLQLAADIGCPGLRVFCGPIPEGMTTAQAIELCGRHLRQVAPLAQKAGVGLWLETHDTFCKTADAVAAIRLADHPSVGLTYDMLHPLRMGESLETTFGLIHGLVRHTHFHDVVLGKEPLKLVRFGQGSTPMDAIIQGLVKLGYDGYLSGEWFVNDLAPSSEKSIEMFRDDIMSLCRRNGVRVA